MRLAVEEEAAAAKGYEKLGRMVAGSAVVVFTQRGCCMCHVVNCLLLGLGVAPAVYEIDQLSGGEVQAALVHLLQAPSAAAAVPSVFIGGKLLGGLEKVMACHINGSLVPLLKQAGALWL